MRKRTDAGVTVVEAAFVLPLLFMFIFGLVDLGMWTLNANQASNAARDGARVGILEYPLPGIAIATEKEEAEAAIIEAVKARLPEGTVEDSDVTITCLADDGSTVSCSGPNPDRVKVDVVWAWRLVTPVATMIGVEEGAATGSATMEIVGRPMAVAPPPATEDPDDPVVPPVVVPCKVANLTTPPSVTSKARQLTQPMLITFDYVEGDCNDLRVALTGTKRNPAETITHYCGCGDAPNHSWLYEGSNNIWQANGMKGTATVLNGDTVLATRDFFVY
jgi:Flp pilus assembly protein TadG